METSYCGFDQGLYEVMTVCGNDCEVMTLFGIKRSYTMETSYCGFDQGLYEVMTVCGNDCVR